MQCIALMGQLGDKFARYDENEEKQPADIQSLTVTCNNKIVKK